MFETEGDGPHFCCFDKRSYSFTHICYRPYEFQGSYILSLFSSYVPLPFMKLSLTSLYGSIVVPMLPLLPALMKIIAALQSPQSIIKLLTFYGSVVLLRVFALYYVPLVIQQKTQTTFDFSDHIVLFYCQIIPIVEHYYHDLTKTPVLSGGMTVTGVFCFYLQSVLPLLVCFTVWRETVRTAMWFHTPVESLVAYGFSYFYERGVLVRIEGTIVGGGANKRHV
ncbi:hypothetical protein TrRE_jg9955 [Triparma retinervis]|uniref:Uncharacterized protein n=1 Tax=Triparma retinervis TaxID=2557542 RepID=A0A9W7FEV9_9STRA|nr:hypothetical protein TrRE_jg9955 [Triparma retinervis]